VNTVITDKILNEMSYKVGETAVTQDVSFLDSISLTKGNLMYCSAKTYSLDPTYTFLTVSGSIVSLLTNSVSDVKEYNVDLRVSLTDYPGVASITKNLVVKIICEV
jgi:hypothetical protein